jgi:hypothetical protein
MDQTFTKTCIAEQRTKPRVNCDYSATIHSLDAQGQKFTQNARVINLSSSGVLLVAKRSFRKNAEIHLKIALADFPRTAETPMLATLGNVVRNELQPDGSIGIAIQFQANLFQ